MAVEQAPLLRAETGLIGSVRADRYPSEEFSFAAFADHAVSGQASLELGPLGPGTRVQRCRVRVRGQAFQGPLANFLGTRVTVAPLVYDEEGAAAPTLSGQRGFVVDFGGLRSVLGLLMPSGVQTVLVLPWMGTDFAQKPIYPISSTFAFYALPAADANGKRRVGFPAIETAKLFVQVKGNLMDATAFAQQVRIVSSVLPLNLRASVGGRPVFFTKPGTLDGEIELTGLTDELNAAVQTLKAPQSMALDVVCDTPGALQLLYEPAQDLELERQQSALWGGRSSLDLPLAALMPTPLELVLPATGGVPWQLRRLQLEVAGRFPRWRAFGPQGVPAGRLSTTVSARFSVARRLVLAGRVMLHGLELPLQLLAAAELRLELLADDQGRPALGEPLAALDLPVAATGDLPAWFQALLPGVVDTGDARALWLVLKGKSGRVLWWAGTETAQAPPATLVAQEGGRWQTYPARDGQAPAPLLRVLREPLPHENAALLTLAWDGTALSARVEPSNNGAALNVELALPGDAVLARTPAGGAITTTLTATALATGTLQLRSAVAFFRN